MKRLSWAPFVYLLFESLIIALTVKIEPRLLEYDSYLTIIFASLIVITNLAFIFLHCKDSSRQDDHKNKQQLELISMRKGNILSKGFSQSKKDSIHSDTNQNKNIDQVQNQAENLNLSIHVEQNNEFKEKTPNKSMKDVGMECEPSMATEIEHEQEEQIQIESLPQSKQNSPEKNKELVFMSPKNISNQEDDQNQVVKIETIVQSNQTSNETEAKGMYNFEMSVKQRNISKMEVTTQDGNTKSTTKTNEQITTNNFNNILTQNNAMHCIFTNENNIIYPSKMYDFQLGNKLDDSKLNYSVLDYPQTAIDVNAKILQSSDTRNSFHQNKLYSFNKQIHEHTIPIPMTSPLNDDGNEIRLEINLNDQINFFQERRQSKIHKNSVDTNILSEIRDGEAQFVEIRHCMECNIEQKIRSKHCKICNRCVATYDHHCPWIGNCIGEKNRCNFWWYLLFQFSELLLALVLAINSLVNKYETSIFIVILDMLLLCFFIVMVGSLLIYHTYLAIENLTTWENARWEKISYLKEWPEQLGSPFNRGWWQNIKHYCKCIQNSKFLTSWYIPKLNNQDQINLQQSPSLPQQQLK